MAEGVYHYYLVGAGLVDCITVVFFRASPPPDPCSGIEPLLLAARIQYAGSRLGDDSASLKAICKEWDTYYLYFDWGECRALGELLSYEKVQDGRIAWARLIAVPLFSIGSIEEVCQLMDRVRGEQAQTRGKT
jgi:hypothetical protein